MAWGDDNCSKQVTPGNLGESRSEPTRSLLVLRAWALWRADAEGWAVAERGRKRYFQEQGLLLERDVRALGAQDCLLGHPLANAMLRSWVPGIVTKLRPSG